MTTTKEEADDAMKAKKELIEQRMKDRQNERETERNPRSETNTEDLVKEFFNDFDPEVDLVLKAMKTIETSAEKDMHQIDNLVKKIQILQESVSDASIFLPAYDSKKCQQTLNDLNNKYQDLLEKVKPKKKFGFKNRKQKPKVPDISSLTVSGSEDQADNVQKYSLDNKNHYDIKDRSDENIVLDRNQVQGKDVTVTGLTGCRLEIHGAPLTLHLTNISECTILSGPVSSSVMVDTCSASSLAISCQQLRTHSTTDTDIYLHTTAKAILEDCRGIRVAPYNWEYPGADQDYSVAGLDRNINNWQQIGDFNWLSSDVPSPNWAILEEEARKQSWN